MWFILALLSAVFAALVTIFGKIGLKTVDSTVAAGVRAVIMALTMIGIIMLLGKSSQITELSKKDMLFIILSGISGALSWVFYFAALKLTEASKVATIDRTSILFIIILSYLILGEEVSLKTLVAGVLVFLGTMILLL
ncbi:MAG: EamA family transporter [Candidatus Brockarchaeota archaeon]|nr:EamA family transporter [Candidatus Brockarchaeota archaeon]